MKRTSVILFVVSFVIGVASLGYAETIDGSIFNDDFNDLTKWEEKAQGGSGAASVSSGKLTVDCPAKADMYALASVGTLDFSSAANDWWLDMSFSVTGNLEGTTAYRQFILLSGTNYYTTSVLKAVTGIDLRVTPNAEDDEAFDLSWYGYDNVDQSRAPTVLTTGLDNGVFHHVQLHRKSNGDVDIYLNDTYIATKDVIVPTVGDTEIKALWMGDGSSFVSGTVVYDYVRVGQAVPEPGTIALLAAGLIGLLAYAWRKHK